MMMEGMHNRTRIEVHSLQSPEWMSHRRCVTRKMSRSNTAFGGESPKFTLSFSPSSLLIPTDHALPSYDSKLTSFVVSTVGQL